MLTTLAAKTLTVLRPDLTDDHGNQVADWSSPTETIVPGCEAQPLSSQEIMEHRDAVLGAQWFYLPPGTDVLATDRIRYDGDDYEVVGKPQEWTSGSGVLDHILILGNEWEG